MTDEAYVAGEIEYTEGDPKRRRKKPREVRRAERVAAKAAPLTPRDKYAAEARAIGVRQQQIADELGCSLGAVVALLQKEKVKRRIRQLQERNEADVVEKLREGEILAADFLNGLLVDDEADPGLRFKAAETLLDRMGLRGRPIERKQEQIQTFSGNMDEAVAKALADPGVQSWLQKGGLDGLKQLPAAVAEEVFVGSHPQGEVAGPAELPVGSDDGVLGV